MCIFLDTFYLYYRDTTETYQIHIPLSLSLIRKRADLLTWQLMEAFRRKTYRELARINAN